ncbi:MAG: phosphoglycerate kinase [bacterium]|nr:phosphoglycerate kinase [bacterium]
MESLRTMDDILLDGKRVIVRVDFNVTAGEDGVVDASEDYRIEAALPTIAELRQKRCKVLLLAHIGRPGEDENLVSMEAIHKRLQHLLRDDVRLLPKLYGSQIESIIQGMEQGDVALFPNVRLDEREMTLNNKFAEDLSRVGDAYINEAFSASHRAHTSIVLLPQLLTSAAGRRTVTEVEVLTSLKKTAKKPYIAIVSGSKITTKIGILRYLLANVDKMCLGGKIANVFLASRYNWPGAMFSPDEIAVAKHILEEYEDRIILPTDVVIGNDDGSYTQTVDVSYIPEHVGGVWDIGPKSIAAIVQACSSAETIIWNGPVGHVEVDAYTQGTMALVNALASSSAYRVVGGGDTVNMLEKLKKVDSFNHVSIGGGAMLEFLEGKRLPGIVAITSQN